MPQGSATQPWVALVALAALVALVALVVSSNFKCFSVEHKLCHLDFRSARFFLFAHFASGSRGVMIQ